MSVTKEDYDRLLEDFRERMNALGDDFASALLYGSVARGDMVPGRSDVLDAYVALDESVFEGKEHFLKVLHKLVKAGEAILDSSIPRKHMFHYYGIDELDMLPAMFVPVLREAGEVLCGEDVWTQVEPNEASRRAWRGAFFGLRQKFPSVVGLQEFLGACRYLKKAELSSEEATNILMGWADSLLKWLLVAACNAVDVWVGEKEAAERIQDVFPNLGYISAVEKAKAIRESPEQYANDTDFAKEFICDCLYFIEELNDRIVEHWTRKRAN